MDDMLMSQVPKGELWPMWKGDPPKDQEFVSYDPKSKELRYTRWNGNNWCRSTSYAIGDTKLHPTHWTDYGATQKDYGVNDWDAVREMLRAKGMLNGS